MIAGKGGRSDLVMLYFVVTVIVSVVSSSSAKLALEAIKRSGHK